MCTTLDKRRSRSLKIRGSHSIIVVLVVGLRRHGLRIVTGGVARNFKGYWQVVFECFPWYPRVLMVHNLQINNLGAAFSCLQSFPNPRQLASQPKHDIVFQRCWISPAGTHDRLANVTASALFSFLRQNVWRR